MDGMAYWLPPPNPVLIPPRFPASLDAPSPWFSKEQIKVTLYHFITRRDKRTATYKTAAITFLWDYNFFSDSEKFLKLKDLKDWGYGWKWPPKMIFRSNLRLPSWTDFQNPCSPSPRPARISSMPSVKGCGLFLEWPNDDNSICTDVFVLTQELATSGSKTLTPTTLQFHKFEEWSHANQQIYKLQSKILDLEAAKIRWIIVSYKANWITRNNNNNILICFHWKVSSRISQNAYLHITFQSI